MSRFDDWDPPLKHMEGSPSRLRGIDVYHDFPWMDVIAHGMRQFPHCQRLADLALANCGSKTPALILTSKQGELEGPFETDSHHYIVVCLPRYIDEADPDEAAAYLARRADVYEARMARLEELVAHPEALHEVLTAEHVADWLTGDPGRAAAVEDALQEGTAPKVDPARAAAALSRYWRALEESPNLRDALLNEEGAAATIVQWVADHPVDAAQALQALSEGELAGLSVAAGIARLQKFLGEWRANRESGVEEYWQQLLTRESWVLGQLLGAPFVMVKGKAYVGGKTYENLEGRIADFLLQNRLTGNILLVEIKTPATPLLASPYRQVHPPSADLAGAVTQALDQKHSLIQNYDNLALEAEGLMPFNPRVVVLIGDLERQAVDGEKRRSFELFRNELAGLEIVTFDELAAKAEALLELFRADGSHAMAATADENASLAG